MSELCGEWCKGEYFHGERTLITASIGERKYFLRRAFDMEVLPGANLAKNSEALYLSTPTDEQSGKACDAWIWQTWTK